MQRVCTQCGVFGKYYAKGLCGACYAKEQRKLHPEKFAQRDRDRIEYKRELDRKRYARRWDSGYFKLMYDKHIEQRRLDDKERWKDPDRRAWMKQWIKDHPEQVRATGRRKYRKHKQKHIAKVMGRRAYKGKATPKWLSEIQRFEMYLMYKNRPQGFHVDHIIPLQGKEVTGLHVPWNLQYLPAADNIRKGNKVA